MTYDQFTARIRLGLSVAFTAATSFYAGTIATNTWPASFVYSPAIIIACDTDADCEAKNPHIIEATDGWHSLQSRPQVQTDIFGRELPKPGSL